MIQRNTFSADEYIYISCVTRSHKRTSMGPSRSCWNCTTSALQPEAIILKGTRVSCVLSIKVPIRKKSGNLSYAPRIYTYTYISHHHHHVAQLAWISLTLSRHFSLSFIASGRSSGLHPVSSISCCMYVRMYVRAGRPAFAWPYAGVHRSTSLMSCSLLLQ